MNKKQIKKHCDKKCYFCDVSDYNLLDAHRIIPGSDGGTYNEWNMLTLCANCHRRCHSGSIVIHQKCFTSLGRHILRCTIDGKEEWV